MIYGFDTDDEPAAVAALIVYVLWRSRDRARFKITPDLWGRIEQFTKDAAKRARTIPDFITDLSRPGRMNAPTIQPRYLDLGMSGETPMVQLSSGAFVQFSPSQDAREFGIRIFEQADAKAVIRAAYRNHKWVIMLVRDRLEREKPIESHIDSIIEDIA